VYKTNVDLKKKAKDRIRKRIRKKISGNQDRPRVIITKSNRYLYLQAVDDGSGRVLAAASTLEKEFQTKNKNTKNSDASQKLGEIFARRLKEKKVKSIVFDRGVSLYHGRVKILAEAMRKGDLDF